MLWKKIHVTSSTYDVYCWQVLTKIIDVLAQNVRFVLIASKKLA